MTNTHKCHIHQFHDSSEANHERSKSNQWSSPGNPCPFSHIIGIIYALNSLWNYPAHKNQPYPVSRCCLLRGPTLWGFSLNKSTSYLSLCLSPNTYKSVQFTRILSHCGWWPAHSLYWVMTLPGIPFLGDSLPNRRAGLPSSFSPSSLLSGLFQSLVGTGCCDFQGRDSEVELFSGADLGRCVLGQLSA